MEKADVIQYPKRRMCRYKDYTLLFSQALFVFLLYVVVFTFLSKTEMISKQILSIVSFDISCWCPKYLNVQLFDLQLLVLSLYLLIRLCEL